MTDRSGLEDRAAGTVGRRSINLARIGRFAVVGAANTGIDLTIFAMLVSGFGWHLLPANIISYSTGIVNSFLLNKYWTFRDRTPLSRSLVPGARFFVINILSLLISTATVIALSRVFVPLVAKLLSVGVVFAWNYVLSDRIVFSRTAP